MSELNDFKIDKTAFVCLTADIVIFIMSAFYIPPAGWQHLNKII